MTTWNEWGALGPSSAAISRADEAGHWGDNPPALKEYGHGCPKTHAHKCGPHQWEWWTTDGHLTTLTYSEPYDSIVAWNAGQVLPLECS